MGGAVEANKERKRQLVDHILMKALLCDGQVARETQWPKMSIHNTFLNAPGCKAPQTTY
jgi:hypothetical protein